jgi:hypothetical protein
MPGKATVMKLLFSPLNAGWDGAARHPCHMGVIHVVRFYF